MVDFDVIEPCDDLELACSVDSMPADPILIKGNGYVTIFGLSSRFDSSFPTKLIGKVAPEEFASTICRVNRVLHKNAAVSIRWLLFGCLCCFCTLSCSLWPVAVLNKRAIASIEKVLDWENNHLYYKLGLQWKLRRIKGESSRLTEYVLSIDALPRQQLYRPD